LEVFFLEQKIAFLQRGVTPLILITFPDGKSVEVEPGIKVYELLAKTGAEASKDAIGISLNGQLLDLQTEVIQGGSCKVICLKDDTAETKHFYRHSMSHVLAHAVKRLFPQAKLAIGPAIEDGFYYDFDVERPFTPEDLEKISTEMTKIIKENNRFERKTLPPQEARKVLGEFDEPYKIEMLEEFVQSGEQVTIYQSGDFVDLCAGPHLRYTSQVKYFKLLDIAGAYWHGDENNKMLQRIYGTAFLKKEDLEQHLWQLEEAKKRDHRRLGKDLDLFSTKPDSVGGGLVLWHPHGGLIRYLIEEHCKRRHLESGYDFVYTPHIGRADLWQTSGHLDFYKDGMYAPIEIEGQQYYLKPMNCPFHVQIYANRVRSYRELPLRFAEWGTVYRFERSGTLHGLVRVRGFTQDDAHLFCRPDQMPAEIDRVLSFSLSMLRDFGFQDFKLYLSTRPEKRVGDDAKWNAAEAALEDALKRSTLPYAVNAGDGAFYGPKIDIYVTDALKRPWQLSTIQFDFNLPERFQMSFIGEDGKEHQPYMIHRALLGSMERFFGVLVEHYGGAFPVWLSPVQATVLPIADRHQEYAGQVLAELKQAGVRAEVDASSNTLNYRIRTAQTQKIPYMLVIGDRELEAKTVAVRQRAGDDLGPQPIDAFVNLVKDKIATKAV
jgi:threonyl-tRNA synthetase